MRNALIVLAAFATGLLVGVLIAGVFLAVSFKMDVNNMNPFLFLDYLPNDQRWGRSPYQEAYWIVMIMPVLALIIAIFALTRAKLSTYGDAHFQSKSEMRRNDMLQPMGAGLLFGRYIKPPHQPKDRDIVIEQDHHSWKRHIPKVLKKRMAAHEVKHPGPFISSDFDKFPNVLVVAPSGAGKTAGYVIPTTITSPGSMVILDVKGEIFEKTSRLRKSYGNKVFRFAPFDFENPSHQYNPLYRIGTFTDLERQFTELQKLASLFLQVEGSNSGDFVGGGVELFTAAGILAIQRGNVTFGEIYRIIYGDGGDVGEETKNATERLQAAAKEAAYPQARQILAEYAGMEPKIRDSYLSVLKSAGLRQWSNPRVERLTRRNEIDFSTIRKERQTIYLCVESDDIPALNSLIRLFFSELIQFLRHSEPGPDEPIPVQIMLDEFFQLGYMPIIVSSLLQLRSHGARISIILQTVSGLGKYYGQDEIDIIMLGAIKIYITANETKTSKELEEALGTRTGLAVSRSKDIDAVGPNSGSVNLSAEDRPLLSAQQIRRLDNTKVIILPERQYPIFAKRISYYDDPELAPWFHSQEKMGSLPYPSADDLEVAEMIDERRLVKAQQVRTLLTNQAAEQSSVPPKNAPPNGDGKNVKDKGDPEDGAETSPPPNKPKNGDGGAKADAEKSAKRKSKGFLRGMAHVSQSRTRPKLSDEAIKNTKAVADSATALEIRDA